MSTYTLTSREIPHDNTYDVIVCGGELPDARLQLPPQDTAQKLCLLRQTILLAE